MCQFRVNFYRNHSYLEMYALKHEYAQTSRNEERSVIASSVEIWSVCRTSDHGRAGAVSGEDD